MKLKQKNHNLYNDDEEQQKKVIYDIVHSASKKCGYKNFNYILSRLDMLFKIKNGYDIIKSDDVQNIFGAVSTRISKFKNIQGDSLTVGKFTIKVKITYVERPGLFGSSYNFYGIVATVLHKSKTIYKISGTSQSSAFIKDIEHEEFLCNEATFLSFLKTFNTFSDEKIKSHLFTSRDTPIEDDAIHMFCKNYFDETLKYIYKIKEKHNMLLSAYDNYLGICTEWRHFLISRNLYKSKFIYIDERKGTTTNINGYGVYLRDSVSIYNPITEKCIRSISIYAGERSWLYHDFQDLKDKRKGGEYQQPTWAEVLNIILNQQYSGKEVLTRVEQSLFTYNKEIRVTTTKYKDDKDGDGLSMTHIIKTPEGILKILNKFFKETKDNSYYEIREKLRKRLAKIYDKL